MNTLFFDGFKNIPFNNLNSVFINNVLNSMINILQKALIILVKDSMSLIESFIVNYFNNTPIEVFENGIKLLINQSSLLKKDCKDLIAKCFSVFFIPIKNTPLPLSSVSESDKATLSVYGNMIKLISNICFDFVEVFYENSEMANLGLVKFLIDTCCNSVDPTLKRQTFKCFKGIIAYLIKYNSEEAYENVKQILNFSILFSLKLKSNEDPTDCSVRYI